MREAFRTLHPRAGAVSRCALSLSWKSRARRDRGARPSCRTRMDKAMRDSGHLSHLMLDRNAGGLVMSDDLLKVISCGRNSRRPLSMSRRRKLHATLITDPRRAVSRGEIAAIEDADARENWEQMIAFRDHLFAYPTLEGPIWPWCARASVVPTLFLNSSRHDLAQCARWPRTTTFVLRPRRCSSGPSG